MTDPEARHNAYRAGLCVQLCGRKYSAGRTRCNECFDAYMEARNEGRTT